MPDQVSASSPPAATKRRIPWIAGLANLVAPPLGHVYAGHPRRGMLVWFGVVLGGLVGLWLARASLGRPGFILLVALLLGLELVLVGDAMIVARRQSPTYRLARYNRWYVYAGLAVALWGTADLLQVGARRYIIEAFKVPSGGMAPTLLLGDHVLVDKLAYRLAAPRRGEIVVLAWPDDRERRHIGRVVGLPGDRVRIEAERVYLNGAPLTEPYAQPSGGPGEAPTRGDSLAEVELREAQYFVLGDNRVGSYDSRFRGPASGRDITGLVRTVYFSWDPSRGAVRWGRIGQGVG
jgi:signal peptidase I